MTFYVSLSKAKEYRYKDCDLERQFCIKLQIYALISLSYFLPVCLSSAILQAAWGGVWQKVIRVCARIFGLGINPLSAVFRFIFSIWNFRWRGDCIVELFYCSAHGWCDGLCKFDAAVGKTHSPKYVAYIFSNTPVRAPLHTGLKMSIKQARGT